MVYARAWRSVRAWPPRAGARSSPLGRLEPRGARRSRCVRAWRSAGRSAEEVGDVGRSSLGCGGRAEPPSRLLPRRWWWARRRAPRRAQQRRRRLDAIPPHPPGQSPLQAQPTVYPPTQNPPHLPYHTHRKTQTLRGATCRLVKASWRCRVRRQNRGAACKLRGRVLARCRRSLRALPVRASIGHTHARRGGASQAHQDCPSTRRRRRRSLHTAEEALL